MMTDQLDDTCIVYDDIPDHRAQPELAVNTKDAAIKVPAKMVNYNKVTVKVPRSSSLKNKKEVAKLLTEPKMQQDVHKVEQEIDPSTGFAVKNPNVKGSRAGTRGGSMYQNRTVSIRSSMKAHTVESTPDKDIISTEAQDTGKRSNSLRFKTVYDEEGDKEKRHAKKARKLYIKGKKQKKKNGNKKTERNQQPVGQSQYFDVNGNEMLQEGNFF